MDKYKIKGNLTESKLDDFLWDYRYRRIHRFILSEEIPQYPVNKFGVMKIVGDNFESTILETNKTIVTLFCVDYDRNCSDAYTRYNKLSQVFNQTDLLFTKMDIVTNENEYFEIEFIPTMLIFHWNRTDDKIRKNTMYKGNYTTLDMYDFLIKDAELLDPLPKIEEYFNMTELNKEDEIKVGVFSHDEEESKLDQEKLDKEDYEYEQERAAKKQNKTEEPIKEKKTTKREEEKIDL